MDFILQIATKAPVTPSTQLMERKAVWEDHVADWGSVGSDTAPLTDQDTNQLKAKLKTATPNYVKAQRIKHLMMQGKGPKEVWMALRGHGWGYGLSTIKHYHAALSA